MKQPQIPLKHNLACRPFSGRRSRRSVRSGYAFAHSEGFGRLITSGRIMREVIFIVLKPPLTSCVFRLVVWGAAVARAPMGRVRSQEVGSLLSQAGVQARAMGPQPGEQEGLVDRSLSLLFPLDKFKTSSLASSQTISGLQVDFTLKS